MLKSSEMNKRNLDALSKEIQNKKILKMGCKVKKNAENMENLWTTHLE